MAAGGAVILLVLLLVFGRTIISVIVDAVFDRGHDAITNARASHKRVHARLITVLTPPQAMEALSAVGEVLPGASISQTGDGVVVFDAAGAVLGLSVVPAGTGSKVALAPQRGVSDDASVRIRSAVLAAIRTRDPSASFR
jgi:hypothetical protein